MTKLTKEEIRTFKTRGMTDFEVWTQDDTGFFDFCDSMGANWCLMRRHLVDDLKEAGFYILSKKELEAMK